MVSPTVDRRFGLVGNAALKAPVLVVATSNITLSGEQTIDGVAVSHLNASNVPDRVLCVGQTSAVDNGIYDVSTAAWSRSADADGVYDFVKGTTVFVTNGTVNIGTYWQITTAGPIVPGTTATTWTSVLAGINTAVATATAEAVIATTEAGIATAQAVIATTQAGLATTAKTAAEVARDAALAAARIYASTAAGIAGTTNGQYFYVVSASSVYVLELWLNSAGVASDTGKRIAASALFDFIKSYSYTTDPGALFQVLSQDSSGDAALGVTTSGEVQAQAYRSNFLNGYRTSQLLSLAGADPNGTFSAEIVHFIDAGQSNAAGRGTAITTAQEYDNVGFAYHVTGPGAFLALTVANTGNGNESPLYATASFMKELIAKENGVTYTTNNYQLCGSNTGYDGFTIANLSKGQAPYTLGLNHVTTGYALATTAGKTFKTLFVTWTQGEADTVLTRVAYKTALEQLATDYNTDIKAATGQTENVAFITWQVNSINVLTAGLAQMDAHESSTLIYCACPEYMFRFNDSLHFDEYGMRWLGDYYGLVAKRLLVDAVQWEPLKPSAATRQGTVAVVRFNKRGLVLDTTIVPAQTNYGFTLVDSGGSPLTISSVSLIGGDRVKVVASSTIPAGAKLRYACNVATGKSSYVGGAGNLRDGYGDELEDDTYKFPMHNFCVAFEQAL